MCDASDLPIEDQLPCPVAYRIDVVEYRAHAGHFKRLTFEKAGGRPGAGSFSCYEIAMQALCMATRDDVIDRQPRLRKEPR